MLRTRALLATSLVAPVTVTTSVSPPGAGAVEMSPLGPSYAPGTAVTLTATVIEIGRTFFRWEEGGTATYPDNPLGIVPVTNRTLTAVFI